jgi:hypothetical protein
MLRVMIESVRLDVVYCEGWDAAARTIVGSLTATTASERNENGEQYAVAMITPETGLPHVILEIAWQHRFLRCWHFDERGRRTSATEYRRLDDSRLFTLRVVEWAYETPEQPEFDEERARRTELEFQLDGTARQSIEPKGRSGGLSVTRTTVPIEDLMLEVPRFGDWAGLTELSEAVELRELSDSQTTQPGTPVGQRPWRPPIPLRPIGLDKVFESGTRYSLPGSDDVVRVDLRDGGTLRMPTGRLIAADPGVLDGHSEPFACTVALGEYRVELAVIVFTENPEHERVAAAKLVISDEPVASWELAVTAEQNPLLLADGRFYGFGVDTGMGCFVDAGIVEPMTAIVEKSLDTLFDVDGRSAELTDPESGANLIAFSSGWGDGAYPTWLGRTANGEVACFVADMLVLHEAVGL